ncbi:Ger(x)C family spore germination protein [Paenibacillus albus]|uniref:Ger(x)C family spore germination protein n=1 Tax=Paenibacillus albus TaxID=2495582 RepID=UPI001D1317BA|nr:hypothetical protein [Paenibacillus albus]
MKRGFAALMMCLLLTGCWDQLRLKDQLFVDIVGIDYVGDSKKLKVGYLISSLREASQGGGKPSSIYIEQSGNSMYESVLLANSSMPGVLTVQETRLYLISTRFAKDEPLKYLNSVGQFVSNPLYASLAVYDGDLSQLLSKKRIKEQTTSDFLNGILASETERGTSRRISCFAISLGGRILSMILRLIDLCLIRKGPSLRESPCFMTASTRARIWILNKPYWPA